MKSELIPNKSYGDFVLGDNISKYLSRVHDFYPALGNGEADSDLYDFYDPPISLWVENDIVNAISCKVECYWRDVNLIGMLYDDFLSFVGEEPEGGDMLYVPISADRGQNQKVYTFDRLGLMVWVWRKKIRTVIITDWDL